MGGGGHLGVLWAMGGGGHLGVVWAVGGGAMGEGGTWG